MALGDGDTWDETTPTDSTVAVQIDDYNRDLRKGVRSRMALEHEWPASQSATSEGGEHKFITLQEQGTKPTLSGTQKGAVYSNTNQELVYENSAGTEIIVVTGTSVAAGATAPTANLALKLDSSVRFPAGTGQLMALNMTVGSGSINHGGTVSLISGFASAQSTVFVSINNIGTPSGGDGDNIEYLECFVSATRVVTCRAYIRSGTYITGTANYLIMGIN